MIKAPLFFERFPQTVRKYARRIAGAMENLLSPQIKLETGYDKTDIRIKEN